MVFPFLIQLLSFAFCVANLLSLFFLKGLEILLIFNWLLNYLHIKVFELLLSFKEQVPSGAPGWHSRVLSEATTREMMMVRRQDNLILEEESPGS